MQSLLSPDEFVRRAVGIPWRKWHSSWSYCDCFGLLVLYHRAVLGLDLGMVPHANIADGFAASRDWIECGPEAGATCFMAWRNEAPTHCGVILKGGKLLHSEGSDEQAGSVRVSRLAAVVRVYGEIRNYRYAPAAPC